MKLKTAFFFFLMAALAGSILAQTPDQEPIQKPQPAAPSAANDQGSIVIPVGTRLQMVLNNFISSKDSHHGDTFYAVVDYPVFIANMVVIPADSLIRGTVVQAEQAGRVRGRSSLTLQFESLVLINGVTKELSAEIFSINDATEMSMKNGSRLEGPSSKGRDVAVAASAGAEGAAIGAIAGGGKGLAIGSAAGGIAGLSYLLAVRGQDVYLDRGLSFELVLRKPIELSPNELDFSKAPVSRDHGRDARAEYRPRDRYPRTAPLPGYFPRRRYGLWISTGPYLRRPWY